MLTSLEAPKPGFERLPPELRIQIMSYITNIATLGSLMRASRQYYRTFQESPIYFLTVTLLAQIPTKALRYACAQALAEDTTKPIQASYSRTLKFLRLCCGVRDPSHDKADGGNKRPDNPSDIRILPRVVNKILQSHKAATRFAEEYCSKILNGPHPINRDAKLQSDDLNEQNNKGSLMEIQRISTALHFLNLFFTLFGQLRTELRDSTREMCQYYDAHISDCFDQEKMFKMSIDSIPDRSCARTKTEAEQVEDEWQLGEFGEDRPDVILLRSLPLWERQEAFVMFKYLVEQLSIAHAEWKTWGWGKAPLEEWSPLELEIRHTFTPQVCAADDNIYRLLGLGLSQLSQFLFDLKTPQQRNFMFRYSHDAGYNIFGLALNRVTALDVGQEGDTPIYPFPPRRIAETDGKNLREPLPNWFHNEDVNPDMCVWDDERLEKWGYYMRSQEDQMKNYPHLFPGSNN